jgi:hypothetical protein
MDVLRIALSSGFVVCMLANPWSDEFDAGNLDPDRWTVISEGDFLERVVGMVEARGKGSGDFRLPLNSKRGNPVFPNWSSNGANKRKTGIPLIAVSLAAPIHLSSVGDLHDYNSHFVVPDLINDPIIASPHPVPLLSGKLLASARPGLLRQRVNLCQNSLQVRSRDSTQISRDGFAEDNLISSHAS